MSTISEENIRTSFPSLAEEGAQFEELGSEYFQAPITRDTKIGHAVIKVFTARQLDTIHSDDLISWRTFDWFEQRDRESSAPIFVVVSYKESGRHALGISQHRFVPSSFEEGDDESLRGVTTVSGRGRLVRRRRIRFNSNQLRRRVRGGYHGYEEPEDDS